MSSSTTLAPAFTQTSFQSLIHSNDVVPFLEEEDVGRDLGPGIGFEGVVGEPDGPQELGPTGDVLPDDRDRKSVV